MKNSFIFLLLGYCLIQGHIMAMECNNENEGTVIDLYTHPAKADGPTPLANFELQDQDGLGTCYANSLSLMLEAELPGHPQVSYQQIAMAYGMAHNTGTYNTRGTRPSTFYSNAMGMSVPIVDGGWSCQAFDDVKARHGFLCNRDEVPVERLGHEQSTVIRALGSFYDSYSSLLPEKGSEGSDAYSAALELRSHLREFARGLHEERGASCVFPRVDPRPPGIIGTLTNICVGLHTQILTLQEEKTTIENTALASRTQKMRDRLTFIDTQLPTLQTRLDTLATVSNRNPSTSDGDTPNQENNGRTGAKFLNCDFKPSVLTAVESVYYRPLEAGTQSMTRLLTQLETELGLPGEFISESITDIELRNRYITDINYANQDFCRRNEGLMVFYETDTIIDEFNQRYHMCLGREFASQFGLAMQGISRMSTLGFPSDSLMDALSSLDLSFNDFVGGIIAPECFSTAAPERIAIPANMSCENEFYPKNGNYFEADGTTKITDAERIAAIQYEASRTSFRSQIDATVLLGRPLGVSICTQFFRTPSANTQYATNCDVTSGTHAMHALPVTGVRCKDGAPQYLLQNSWGHACSSYLTTTEDPANGFECNEAQGSVWVREEALIRNMNQTYSLERDRPPRVVVPADPAAEVLNRQR